MQYGDGTVTMTNASTTVTATGSLWTTKAASGYYFGIVGDYQLYVIDSVTSDTELELTEAYEGVTGQKDRYFIVRAYTKTLQLPLIRKGDRDWPIVWEKALDIIDARYDSADADDNPNRRTLTMTAQSITEMLTDLSYLVESGISFFEDASKRPMYYYTGGGGPDWKILATEGPVITEITPDDASVGQVITIEGNYFGNLQADSTVTINGVDAGRAILWQEVTSWDPNSKIQIQVPNTATTGDVIVTVNETASEGFPITIS